MTAKKTRRLRRTMLAVLAVSVLVVAALGWGARDLLRGITVSAALGADAPHSTDGSTNVLLIGLDSRKEQNGDDLPSDVLSQLHAGDSSAGGYNTNTLILVHIGGDGSAVAFSIPRDDYVPATGIIGRQYIKIKEAYGLTKVQAEAELRSKGDYSRAELEQQSREAARKATLGAVRDLTGQPIDYFAEVNLAGFYHLTQALGGVDVCLNHAVSDDFSGANFPAGRQRLNAAQAVAFVRQRHGLTNGDLDRTHRQQAFLASVMHQLRESGVLADLRRSTSLLDVVRRDVVLSQGWGESQFRRMASLADGDVEFRTLPVVRYEIIDGSDVNIVDPSAIRSEVTAAIDGDETRTATGVPAAPVSDTWGGTAVPGTPNAGSPVDAGGVPCVD